MQSQDAARTFYLAPLIPPKRITSFITSSHATVGERIFSHCFASQSVNILPTIENIIAKTRTRLELTLSLFLFAWRLRGKRFARFGLLDWAGLIVLLFGPHFGPGVARPFNVFMLFPEALATLVKIDPMFQLSAVRRAA